MDIDVQQVVVQKGQTYPSPDQEPEEPGDWEEDRRESVVQANLKVDSDADADLEDITAEVRRRLEGGGSE